MAKNAKARPVSFAPAPVRASRFDAKDDDDSDDAVQAFDEAGDDEAGDG
jgi:hypothetical protein